jgi:hypothetical protein
VSRAKRTVAEAIATLNKKYTQKEIASLLSISERTVRRYKRGDTEPTSATLRKRVRQNANRAAKSLYRQGYAPAAVPIPWMRRTLKTASGEIPSEWVNYFVRDRTLNVIFDLIKANMNKGVECQFLVEITTGRNKGDPISGDVIVLEHMNDSQIWKFINDALFYETSGDNGAEGDEDKGVPNIPLYVGFKRVII